MAGLSKKHHGELNKCNVSRERFDELRRQYATDDKALQQIDVYDGDSPYHPKFRIFRDALFGRVDRDEGERAYDWLRRHYPDI